MVKTLGSFSSSPGPNMKALDAIAATEPMKQQNRTKEPLSVKLLSMSRGPEKVGSKACKFFGRTLDRPSVLASGSS